VFLIILGLIEYWPRTPAALHGLENQQDFTGPELHHDGVVPPRGIEGQERVQIAEPALETVSSTRVQIRGPWEQRDAHGNPALPLDGVLRFEVQAPSGAPKVIVDGLVSDGQWIVEAETDASLRPVRFMTSNGRLAKTWDVDVNASAGDGQVLGADWLPGPTLFVRSRTDGQLIREASVSLFPWSGAPTVAVEMGAWQRAQGDRFLSGAVPLELPEFIGTMAGWVSAIGYVPSRFGFYGGEGKRDIYLSPASILNVTIRDPESIEAGSRLLLWDAEVAPWILLHDEPLGSSGLHQFSQVPNSVLAVTLQAKGPRRLDGYVDMAIVEPVNQEAVRSAHLAVSPRLATTPRGTLQVRVLGQGLDPSCFVLSAAADDIPPLNAVVIRDLSQAGSGQSAERFLSFSNLCPGTYRLDLSPGIGSQDVIVSPDRETTALFQLAGSCRLEFIVLDEDSGEPIGDATVMTRAAGSTTAMAWTVAAAAQERRTYSALVGRGPIECIASAPGYPWKTTQLAATQQDLGVTLMLQRVPNYQIRARAAAQGTPVVLPTAEWTRTSVAPVSASGGTWYRRGQNEFDGPSGHFMAMDWFVDRPGSYRLDFPRFRGFRPVPPVDVTVDADGVAEVLVELVAE
jgi:hypothetical protein